MQDSKKQLNVKVSDAIMELLDKAAYFLRKTKTQIVEDAIQEFAKSHHISGHYQLNVKNGMLVLIRVEGDRAEIVEMEMLNGVAPEDIATRYSQRYNQAVPLVVEK